MNKTQEVLRIASRAFRILSLGGKFAPQEIKTLGDLCAITLPMKYRFDKKDIAEQAEYAEKSAKCEPEDVQLDVEGLARAAHENYRLKHPEMRIMPWADISEGARQINRERVELVLALLRRVSGKGARPRKGDCINCHIDEPCAEHDVASPAPVPATPEIETEFEEDESPREPRDLAVTIVDMCCGYTMEQAGSPRHHRYLYDRVTSFIQGLLNYRATTQGTPEGAK